MNLVLITAPTVEPVDTNDMKEHSRITTTNEEVYLDGLITAARKRAEKFLNRALITQVWELRFDAFPGNEIKIPMPPLQSVDSVKYTDLDGNEQTFTDYELKYDDFSARIRSSEGFTWPSTKYAYDAVKIRFTAGYGDNPEDVEEDIRQAIKIITAELYERREEALVGLPSGGVVPVPLTSENLMWPYRVINF